MNALSTDGLWRVARSSNDAVLLFNSAEMLSQFHCKLFNDNGIERTSALMMLLSPSVLIQRLSFSAELQPHSFTPTWARTRPWLFVDRSNSVSWSCSDPSCH